MHYHRPSRFLLTGAFIKHRGNGATSQVGIDTTVLCFCLDERRWLGGELLGAILECPRKLVRV